MATKTLKHRLLNYSMYVHASSFNGSSLQYIMFTNYFCREHSIKIGLQMELVGFNLTEDQLEDVLEQGQGA